ncbi:reverse transcriptase domain-containing protein, partial [Escherichia coli]|uniref:reverse transcriptase domain-containing protein n=1 Tax=Escherichia coli TaxID=562 RepID=UPI0037553C29
MTQMFEAQLGKTVEVYVDDMVVKIRAISEHVTDLGNTFQTLREHKLCLNASKCSFNVGSGKFQGYMLTHRGIEANPEQFSVICN